MVRYSERNEDCHAQGCSTGARGRENFAETLTWENPIVENSPARTRAESPDRCGPSDRVVIVKKNGRKEGRGGKSGRSSSFQLGNGKRRESILRIRLTLGFPKKNGYLLEGHADSFFPALSFTDRTFDFRPLRF